MNNQYRTEDSRYEAIRQATIDCAGQEYFDKYYRDTGKRWLDLARVWDKVLTCSKHFVLTSVIHKIMWGVLPYENSSAEFMHLFALVGEELLRDGEAFQAWAKWRVFGNVLAAVTGSTNSFGRSGLDSHFITHYHYLRDRALYEIKYSKESCLELDLSIDTRVAYEEAVELLVPDSKKWSRQQWGNDLVLADELEKLYGVNFAETWESQREFDRLINLIHAWRIYKMPADVYWYATNITNLPDGIIQRIWPQNTNDILADILISAYKALVDYEKAGEPFAHRKSWIDSLYHYERAAFKNSWIFNYVSDRYYQGAYQGETEKQLRKIIFDIQTTTY